MVRPKLMPASHYAGQVIHHGGHRYTIIAGPEFEFAAVASARNERGQDALLVLRLGANGEIVRASTRPGSWQTVTVTARQH